MGPVSVDNQLQMIWVGLHGAGVVLEALDANALTDALGDVLGEAWLWQVGSFAEAEHLEEPVHQRRSDSRPAGFVIPYK